MLDSIVMKNYSKEEDVALAYVTLRVFFFNLIPYFRGACFFIF